MNVIQDQTAEVDPKEIIKFVQNVGDDLFPPLPNIKLYFALWLYKGVDEATDIYAEFNEFPSEKHTNAFQKVEHVLPSLAQALSNQISEKNLGTSLVETVEFTEVLDGSHVDVDKLKTILEHNNLDIFDTTVFLLIGSDDVKIYSAGKDQLDSLLRTVNDRDVIWMVEDGEPSLI